LTNKQGYYHENEDNEDDDDSTDTSDSEGDKEEAGDEDSSDKSDSEGDEGKNKPGHLFTVPMCAAKGQLFTVPLPEVEPHQFWSPLKNTPDLYFIDLNAKAGKASNATISKIKKAYEDSLRSHYNHWNSNTDPKNAPKYKQTTVFLALCSWQAYKILNNVFGKQDLEPLIVAESAPVMRYVFAYFPTHNAVAKQKAKAYKYEDGEKRMFGLPQTQNYRNGIVSGNQTNIMPGFQLYMELLRRYTKDGGTVWQAEASERPLFGVLAQLCGRNYIVASADEPSLIEVCAYESVCACMYLYVSVCVCVCMYA